MNVFFFCRQKFKFATLFLNKPLESILSGLSISDYLNTKSNNYKDSPYMDEKISANFVVQEESPIVYSENVSGEESPLFKDSNSEDIY